MNTFSHHEGSTYIQCSMIEKKERKKKKKKLKSTWSYLHNVTKKMTKTMKSQ